MKKYLMALVLILFAVPALSIPQQIYFQGILLDDNNDPVSGTHVFTFRIYDASAGGSQLWQETHTSVAVSNGLYTVKLGSVASLSATVFESDPRYIGVQVDSDPEMTPRVQLLSVPFAHRAQYAESAGGAISTPEADSRYVFKSGDTMTGALTMAAGVIRSNVSDAQGVSAFNLTTNNAMNSNTGSPYYIPTASLFSVTSGTTTSPAFAVLQSADAISWRGFKVPAYDSYLSRDFYLLGGSLAGNQAFYIGYLDDPTNMIIFNTDGTMEINSESIRIGRISSDLQPAIDVDSDLGSLGSRWNYVFAAKYFGDGSNLTGIYSSGEASNTFVKKVGDTMTGVLTMGAGIVPGGPGSYDLGDPTYVWRNVYADNYYGDGSTLSNIVVPSDLGNYVAKTGDTMTGDLTLSGSANLYANNLISGNYLYLTNYLTVEGQTFLNSSKIYLGDSSVDDVYINADVSSDIHPGGLFALGSNTQRWQNVHATNYNGFYLYLTEYASVETNNELAGRFVTYNTDGRAIEGIAANTNTNPKIGGYFEAGGPQSKAVYGFANSTTGGPTQFGGYFETAGNNQTTAVYGAATNESAVTTTWGGKFISKSLAGVGVYGEADPVSDSNTHFGGKFVVAESQGIGVRGENNSSGYGGQFYSQSGTALHSLGSTVGGSFESWSGTAVRAKTGTGTGLVATYEGGAGNYAELATATYAGHFDASASSGRAVYGNASTTIGGTNYGGYFEAAAASGRGVYGEGAYTGPVENYGGEFIAKGNVGRAVKGHADATGAVTNYGGYFVASGDTGYGVFGQADSSAGSLSYGGYFSSISSGGYGIFAAGGLTAGYFQGSVEVTGNLNVGGTLSKAAGSFTIDHPLDPAGKVLRHSFVESPDMKNVYDGVVSLNEKGEAVVTLPDYFEALNKDFRYQLTCIGDYAPVYIKEKISDNKFKVAGGKPGMEVSWLVTGSRQDVFALDRPIIVEEDKAIRGTYLYPAGFNKKHANK